MRKRSDSKDVKPAAGNAPKLTRAQKAEVVRRLASYESPSLIAKSLKEDFGIEITRQAVAFYDPTQYSNRPSPKRWSQLFWRTRARIIKGKVDIGAVHPRVRLLWLDKMARAQMEKGYAAEARALLRQAADEMSQIAGHRHEEKESDDSKLSEAELKADIDEYAATLGLAVVPLEALQAEAGDDGAAEGPQPPGKHLSG
jgi:hypothetical protein